MFLIGVVGVVGILKVRPDVDALLVIGAVFAFLVPTTASILAFQKSQETHLSVNSRLDGFIQNAAIASKAQGEAVGRNEANARTDIIREQSVK
jgi:hypothetical protein